MSCHSFSDYVNSEFKIILIADFILAYTIVGLEVHFFSTKGVHVISLEDYHESRTSAKIEPVFVILYLQVTINSAENALIFNIYI